jgi:ferrous iron transport protein A
MPSLSQLRIGQRGRIDSIAADEAALQRLLEMGLLEGAEVEVIAVAPLGDPIEVRLGDYRLSLRRSEADRVLVSLL